MTDEEKKEYEELKSLLYTGTISQYGKRKLIDIIEEQQKEIDFFRNNNCCFESTEQGLYAIQLKPENYVPKDKIKEKIEELKQYKEEIKDEKDFEYFTTLRIIKALKSLLGE